MIKSGSKNAKRLTVSTTTTSITYTSIICIPLYNTDSSVDTWFCPFAWCPWFHQVELVKITGTSVDDGKARGKD